MKKLLPAGSMKIIHVNQHIIRANALNDTRKPAITVKVGRQNFYAFAVEIRGPVEMIYSPQKPLLSCGARLIQKTKAEVLLKGVRP